MQSWAVLSSTKIPNSDKELTLLQRGDEFAIRISGVPGDLMNSRMHNSEEALAELACTGLKTHGNAEVLVGGLGMGFTLAAALNTVPRSARVTVAELIPAVVDWNQGPLGECAGMPLKDSRTRIHTGDVAELIVQPSESFDAIMLDVDNGPEAMTHTDNDWLYSLKGLKAIHQSLRLDGIAAFWSARDDQLFNIRLKKSGFKVHTRTVRARPGKGSRHTIFLAHKLPTRQAASRS
jgi:spermidine synthase